MYEINFFPTYFVIFICPERQFSNYEVKQIVCKTIEFLLKKVPKLLEL